jgi:hypothetical protein
MRTRERETRGEGGIEGKTDVEYRGGETEREKKIERKTNREIFLKTSASTI